jgi:hypothetical protein
MDGSHSLLIRSDSSLALRCRKGAIPPSFDHLAGSGEQRRGHVEAERLGGLEVDHHMPTDTKIFLTMAILGLATMLIVLRRLI